MRRKRQRRDPFRRRHDERRVLSERHVCDTRPKAELEKELSIRTPHAQVTFAAPGGEHILASQYAYANGGNLPARSAMMEGSLLAGMAFANAGVTAVHAFAYPIGAEFHIPHGVANTLMLPHVMRFNVLGNVVKFARMADAFCLIFK